MTRLRWTLAVTAPVALALGGAFSVAGGGGLVAAAYAVTGLALPVLAALYVGANDPPRHTPTRAPRTVDDTGAFPAYRKIVSCLIWSGTARRHFDRITRPVLQRITAALLAERHRVDPEADPAAARALLGGRAWALLDPARPPDDRDGVPGVAHEDLVGIVERLERL